MPDDANDLHWWMAGLRVRTAVFWKSSVAKYQQRLLQSNATPVQLMVTDGDHELVHTLAAQFADVEVLNLGLVVDDQRSLQLHDCPFRACRRLALAFQRD